MNLAETTSEQIRIDWIEDKLKSILDGACILNVDAEKLRLKLHCAHLDSISQDFCLYEGQRNKKALFSQLEVG